MNNIGDTYLRKVINEAIDETATGSGSFDDFKNVASHARDPLYLQNGYNPNPRMGFIYHGTDSYCIDSICKTGASGSKEYLGAKIGQVYGRGLYAMLNLGDVCVGNGAVVEFAVKPGAFDNFIIFEHSYRSLLFRRGLLTREDESLGENIERLLDKDSLDMFRRNGVDLNHLSHHSFMSYMTNGESRYGGHHSGWGSENRLDRTKIDGFTINYGAPAVVVRRMDIVVPYRYKKYSGDEWHDCIENEEHFDRLNLYYDAHARVRDKYPKTNFNQKPSAGFLMVGNSSHGNYINLRTDKYMSAVPLSDCTNFSVIKDNGFNYASFSLGNTAYIARTNDDGKNVQILFKPKNGGEYTELPGGQEVFYKLSEIGLDGSLYEQILRWYGDFDFNQNTDSGLVMVGNANRGNFCDIKSGKFFSPTTLKNCTPVTSSGDGYVGTFTLGINKFELVAEKGSGLKNASVCYYSPKTGERKEMNGGYKGFVELINKLLAQAKKPVNESFMQGTYDDFMNNEVPNTTTLYSRANNLEQFASDIKNGKNIYFYTCSQASNAKSMMTNGMTYEFTGTSNDTTTFQGVVAYGSFSLAGAEKNMGGYGNAIYKFVLKDDLHKYLIFDPRIREVLGMDGETLSQQVRKMCGDKKYKGKRIIDILDDGLKRPKTGYSPNYHLAREGVNGLDRLSRERQGDACAAVFWALKGSLVGALNGATMYDEGPLHLMGLHGYIYNGGNHWDCICVRNHNALMPVAYAVSKNGYPDGLPRDSKGHIIWTKNEYLNAELFDKLNNNVSARFQYAGEYPDTPLKTKQSCGFTLVQGRQGYNFMDVRTHRHLLPIDVEYASRFVEENGIGVGRFVLAKSEWVVLVDKGGVQLVYKGKVISPNKFTQLIGVMKQKHALPQDAKIHTDAILYDSNVELLEEAKNLGITGRVGTLLGQEQKLNSKGMSFFGQDVETQQTNLSRFKQIQSILNSGNSKQIEGVKNLLRKIFENDNLSKQTFTDEDARYQAAWCVYGEKMYPILGIRSYDPKNNKYYQALVNETIKNGQQVAAASTSTQLLANVNAKAKNVQAAVDGINIQPVEGFEQVAAAADKYKSIYFKGNTIFSSGIAKNGDYYEFTKTGRTDWVAMKNDVKGLGFKVMKPKVKTFNGVKLAFAPIIS